jgi:methionyl-tRNA formyltransferase
MNSVFLFTGYDRVDLLDIFLSKRIRVEALVVPANSKYISRMVNLISNCIKLSIPIISAKELSCNPYLSKMADSILYSSGYPLILAKEVFTRFKYALNCHPSKLPRNRGKYLEYILINDDKQSGCTIHHMTEGCDDGPIILQSVYPVEFTDTVDTLLSKSYHDELKLLLRLIEDPSLLEQATAQDESKATCFVRQRTPQDSELDSSETLLNAYLKSRAFNSDLYPGYFRYGQYTITFRMQVSEDF